MSAPCSSLAKPIGPVTACNLSLLPVTGLLSALIYVGMVANTLI